MRKGRHTMADDPLRRLVRTEEELLDKELLTRALEGLVFIDPERQRVTLTREARALTARKLLLVYLLGRKALATVVGGEVVEAATPKEIEEVTGLSGGTVRPNLRTLYADKIVDTGDNGYSVPSYRLPEAARLIMEG
jgi:hypothetical protein